MNDYKIVTPVSPALDESRCVLAAATLFGKCPHNVRKADMTWVLDIAH